MNKIAYECGHCQSLFYDDKIKVTPIINGKKQIIKSRRCTICGNLMYSSDKTVKAFSWG